MPWRSNPFLMDKFISMFKVFDLIKRTILFAIMNKNNEKNIKELTLNADFNVKLIKYHYMTT